MAWGKMIQKDQNFEIWVTFEVAQNSGNCPKSQWVPVGACYWTKWVQTWHAWTWRVNLPLWGLLGLKSKKWASCQKSGSEAKKSEHENCLIQKLDWIGPNGLNLDRNGLNRTKSDWIEWIGLLKRSLEIDMKNWIRIGPNGLNRTDWIGQNALNRTERIESDQNGLNLIWNLKLPMLGGLRLKLEGFGPKQFWEEATQNKRMIWTAFGKKGLKQITWWNCSKNHAWNLTGNLTRKVKTSPFLGLLGTQTVQKLLWDGPGGLASALASAWDMPNLVFMHFEAKKRTKTGVFWHEIWLKKWKRVRSWPFWGQKITFWVPGGLARAWEAWHMPW